jgi:hypothetical protein
MALARTMVALGNASWTTRSPRPRERMYAEPDFGSAPIPETRTKRATPARAASRASVGASLVHGLERYAARLDIGRNRIDDRVGPGDRAGDRGSVTHVGAEHRDPFHARRTERNSRLVGMPDCNAHSHSLGSEAPHETLAEKPRAAEHANRGHSIPFRMPHRVDSYRSER